MLFQVTDFLSRTKWLRLSAGGLVCLCVHPQEHTRENMYVLTRLARAENVCLILQAQLQAPSEMERC